MLKNSLPEISTVTKNSSAVFDDMTQEILGRGNQLRFKAHGNSMFPFVRNGDCIIVKPETAGSVKVGDIILFRYPGGTYIVHRVIKKNGQTSLLTRGDNMPGYDLPVPNECVLGKVTQIEGRGKLLKLGGWPNRAYACSIALSSRIRFRGQVRLTRIMSILCWLFGGKRIT
jgi:signal peptidase I